MDSKKLQALLMAVERGSLTAAAAELGYTQSGLTHMMNALEEELGINLLIRKKSGVSLSAEGEKLLPEMQDFVSAADALEQRAAELNATITASVKIGAYASVARHWMPSVLAEYKRLCPDVDISITMGGIEAYNAVREGVLDCAVVSYQKSLCKGLVWVPLRDDELVAVLPRSAARPETGVSASDFAGKEFLMPSSGFELDIMPVFAQTAGELPHFRYTNMDDASIVSMVEHGLGRSILSRLVMQGGKEGVKLSALDPPAYRKLGFIVCGRRKDDRNIRHLLHCAQSTLAKMYGARCGATA